MYRYITTGVSGPPAPAVVVDKEPEPTPTPTKAPTPSKVAQAYEKVEDDTFGDQYWYTKNAGDAEMPNSYYITNIAENKNLTVIDG